MKKVKAVSTNKNRGRVSNILHYLTSLLYHFRKLRRILSLRYDIFCNRLHKVTNYGLHET